MKYTLDILLPLITIALTACLGLAVADATDSSQDFAPAKTAKHSQPNSDFEKQRQNAENQARPEIEKQRKEAEQQAEKTLDKEAIAAIQETQNAINAIAANKTDEALSALERATGKIHILLARNPATALIPVNLEVDVIDTAPHDLNAIREIAQDASKAVDDKNFPAARLLLQTLMSEIRVRTYNLPLATYPTALKDAARLLDQKKTKEASDTLLTALNTLMVVDNVTPLPLVLAREAINQAQTERQKDKNMALTLLETAKKEIQRSKELGYAGQDQEYAALNNDIDNLEKQLKGNRDTMSVFSRLKEKLTAFVHRQSGAQSAFKR